MMRDHGVPKIHRVSAPATDDSDGGYAQKQELGSCNPQKWSQHDVLGANRIHMYPGNVDIGLVWAEQVAVVISGSQR